MALGIGFSIALNGLKNVRQLLTSAGGYTEATYKWGQVVADESREGIQIATATWRTRPIVTTRVRGGVGTTGWGGRTAEIDVYVSSPSYTFVDKGTRAHAIMPKREGGVLRFNSVFSAKSRPRRLRAYVGRSGPPVRFARAVWHPGTVARGFSELAAARGLREGAKRIQAELNAIIAGHSVWASKMWSVTDKWES